MAWGGTAAGSTAATRGMAAVGKQNHDGGGKGRHGRGKGTAAVEQRLRDRKSATGQPVVVQ